MERIPLGTYVAERRKALSLRQSDLAQKLGYSTQAISKFESGECQIALSVVPDLCNLLSISLDDFFLRRSGAEKPLAPVLPFDSRLLSTNLSVYRSNASLSLVEEATLIGISKNSLIAYEKGSTLPSLEAMDGFLTSSQVNPSTFFYERLPSAKNPAKRKKGWVIGAISLLGVFGLAAVSLGLSIYFSRNGIGTETSGVTQSQTEPSASGSDTTQTGSLSTSSEDDSTTASSSS